MSILKAMNEQQLEEEFKSEFPDLPEEIISACVNQHGPDKETCIKILKDIRQHCVFLENTSLPLVDKFDSEEISSRLESYDFKFEGSSLREDDNSITKGLNNLTISTKIENSDHNYIRNENPNIKEEEKVHITNGNFLPTTKPNTSNVFDLRRNAYGTSDFGYVSYVPHSLKFPNVHMINQQETSPKPTNSYAHNYARGNSYPTTNNRNVPFNTQFSYPTSYPDFSTAKFSPDYSVPLYVMVTSSPHYPSATITTSNPRFLISPLPTPPNLYPTTISNLSPSYHPPDLKPSSFSQSQSSVSPCYPTSSSSPLPSTDANSHHPALSISPNITYPYQGSIYVAQNHQRNNTWENNEMPHQTYKLFPESSARNFMNQNTYMNLQTSVMPPLSSILFLPQHQTIENKENNAERAYRKALIQHQKMQLEMLQIEVYKRKQFCYTLRKDVSLLEERLQGKRKNEFTNMEEIQKLREENMNLRVECNCLNLETEMLQQKEQMRLGVVDEGFYKNIFTGPPIPSGSSEKREIGRNDRYEDDEDGQGTKWNCSKCTYANHPALEHCEMCDYSRLPTGKSPVSPLVLPDECYCHKRKHLNH